MISLYLAGYPHFGEKTFHIPLPFCLIQKARHILDDFVFTIFTPKRSLCQIEGLGTHLHFYWHPMYKLDSEEKVLT